MSVFKSLKLFRSAESKKADIIIPVSLGSLTLISLCNNPEKWTQIMKNAMTDIVPAFDSDRMADEYYSKIYNCCKREL